MTDFVAGVIGGAVASSLLGRIFRRKRRTRLSGIHGHGFMLSRRRMRCFHCGHYQGVQWDGELAENMFLNLPCEKCQMTTTIQVEKRGRRFFFRSEWEPKEPAA